MRVIGEAKGKHDTYIGIGHTRWATLGGKSDLNAHPHTDINKNLALVHNGNILNHDEIRQYLASH